MKKTILIFMALLASLSMSSFGATKTMDAVSVIHSIIDMKEDTDFVVTGEISNEILSYIANVIKESKYKIGLDLSNTTGLSYLGEFSGCENLTSIILPNCVKKIESQTFNECTGLTTITIPSSVIKLGYYAFGSCYNLKTVSILGNITRIESGTFLFCKSLYSINLPDSVTWIGEDAFKECKNLASITIPASVRIIDKTAFRGCTKLAKVSFSEGLSEIRRGAFYNCTSLVSITIPASVTCIEQGAFNETGLTSAIFKNTKWKNNYSVEMDDKLKNPSTAATFLKVTAYSWNIDIYSYNK